MLLGIDIGTSACKLALFDAEGRVAASASRDYEVYYPAPRWAEQDANQWWYAVVTGIKALLETPGISASDIDGIGIDGQSWSAIPVDAEGEVLCNTPIWMDARAQDVCDQTLKTLGEDALFEVGANPFSPSYTLPKVLYWMQTKPELIKKAAHILQSNSFIVYRLTGVISQDLSQCYGWHNFSQKKLQYDMELTRALGVDKKFLIDPIPSSAIAGRVTKEAAELTGLKEGTPVAAGGLDAACGTLGAGVINPGQTQEQGGQAGGMSICTDTPTADKKLILSTHVVPNRWLLQGGSAAGGASLKWFAEALGAEASPDGLLSRTGSDVFSYLSAEAETVSAGSGGLIYLPYLSGERSPIWDAKAQGMFFGLRFGTTHAQLARAVMEGVAYSLRHNLETAKAAGADVSEMRTMGGAANSRVWTQLKADVTGKPIAVPSSDTATTCGAAMLAGVGVGVYKDFDEAVAKTVRIHRTHQPDASSKPAYDELFEIYKGLYENTKGLMWKLSDMREKYAKNGCGCGVK